jgi:hypothetical protein
MENLNREITFVAGLKLAYLNRLDPQGEAKLGAAIVKGKQFAEQYMELVESGDANTLTEYREKFGSDTQSVFEFYIASQVKTDISFRQN